MRWCWAGRAGWAAGMFLGFLETIFEFWGGGQHHPKNHLLFPATRQGKALAQHTPTHEISEQVGPSFAEMKEPRGSANTGLCRFTLGVDHRILIVASIYSNLCAIHAHRAPLTPAAGEK
ncbi:hypothetical protein B0O99DRAFT_58229 [Bisporella sp. PMI_857]|nr:hypothetical protein B0O99DRAFT_58229 [Bisporella sp. PMI_857]